MGVPKHTTMRWVAAIIFIIAACTDKLDELDGPQI